jgi:hypothetical protein
MAVEIMFKQTPGRLRRLRNKRAVAGKNKGRTPGPALRRARLENEALENSGELVKFGKPRGCELISGGTAASLFKTMQPK